MGVKRVMDMNEKMRLTYAKDVLLKILCDPSLLLQYMYVLGITDVEVAIKYIMNDVKRISEALNKQSKQ